MAGRDLGSFFDSLEKMDLLQISEDAIDLTIDRISERNVDQLRHGLTSLGTHLRPYRSNKYARVKNEMNPLPGLGNPDFILFGGFTGAIRTERVGDTIGTHSYDPKAPKLENRDGANNIYGMDEEEHAGYVNEDLQPVFMQEIFHVLNE